MSEPTKPWVYALVAAGALVVGALAFHLLSGSGSESELS